MGTTADKLEYLQGTKAAIKQAIVNKGVAVPDGTTFRGYAEKIGAIIDVPDLSNPGAAGDLRSGKQLVGADGSIVTGTLSEVIQATPTISVSSGGLITASATQSGGIVEAGTKSSTKQLTTQGAATIMPGTTDQIAVASGRYTTGDVKVAGDANLVPENIAEGASIFGVMGTLSGMLSSYYKSVVLNSSDPTNWFITNSVDCVVAIIISTGGGGGGSSTSISAMEALLAYKGGQMIGDNYTLTLNTDGTMATVQLTGRPGSGRKVIFAGFNY